MNNLTANVDGMNITITIETITPAQAKKLYESNTRNRNIVRSSYAKVRRAMERDEWVFDGGAIRIAADGRILDGQHRLLACIETGNSFTTIVVRGLEDETQRVMDSGAKRTLAQKFTIEGIKNAHKVATIANYHSVEQAYGFTRAMRGVTGENGKVTDAEAFENVKRHHDEYQDLVRLCAQLRGEVPLATGPLSVLLRRFEAIDRDDAIAFWDGVKRGENMGEGHPIFTLRALYRNVFNKESAYRGQYEIAALTVKAWNAWRDGTPVKALRFKAGGSNPEKFPEPR